MALDQALSNIYQTTTLTDRQTFIAQRLDKLFDQYNIPFSASKLYKGGLFAMQPNLRANPDWMSQSAHSFREIFYHVLHQSKFIQFPNGTDKKSVLFEMFGTRKNEIKHLNKLGKIYNMFSDIAHHYLNKPNPKDQVSESDYDGLVHEFEDELYKILFRQLDVHERLGELVLKFGNAEPEIADIEANKNYITKSLDAAQYFYSIVTPESLSVLIEHGFYDDLQWSVKHFELDQWLAFELFSLERLASKAPDMIASIFLNYRVAKDADPAATRHSLIRSLAYIQGDNREALLKMLDTPPWSFKNVQDRSDYLLENLAENIVETGNWNHFILYLKVRFAVDSSMPTKYDPWSRRGFNPFNYAVTTTEQTLVGLLETPSAHTVDTLKLLCKIFNNGLCLESHEAAIFPYQDAINFLSFDVVSTDVHSAIIDYDTEIIEKLLLCYKHLAERVIAASTETEDISLIWNELPDSPICWKLRYHLIGMAGMCYNDLFVEESVRFTHFDEPTEFLSGAEYGLTISKHYPRLNDQEKKKIFQNYLLYFNKESENSHRKIVYATPVFSAIQEFLSIEQLNELAHEGIELIENYKPTPSISTVTGGMVLDQSPINKLDLAKLPVNELIEKIEKEWHPEKIIKRRRSKSFLRPINASGLGKLIAQDMKERASEYLPRLKDFLKPEKITLTYVYHILDGLVECFRGALIEEDQELVLDFVAEVLSLYKEDKLVDVTYSEDFQSRFHDLTTKEMIFSRVRDLVAQLVEPSSNFIDSSTNPTSIEQLGKILEIMLLHEDPKPTDEELSTTQKTVSKAGGPSLAWDAQALALSSIRGRAFMSYMNFLTHLNESRFQHIHPAERWQSTLKDFIYNEKTRALHFMFGFYTCTIFNLDRSWLLHQTKHLWSESYPYVLRLQVWIGFLRQSPWTGYLELPMYQDAYVYWITNPPVPETDREYSGSFDTGIATHMMNYFVYAATGNKAEQIVDLFFEKGCSKSNSRFIDLIGHHIIDEEHSSSSKLPEGISQSLKDLWHRYLDHRPEQKILECFSFWVSNKSSLLSMDTQIELILSTLKSTDGKLSFLHPLEGQLMSFAKRSPEQVLEICELLILNGTIRNKSSEQYLYLRGMWVDLFQFLYTTPFANKTEALVSRIIEEGGSEYWALKK
ncbi:hypothetical protein [Nonlabens marinus]|uniref:Uncharacterized protein n=1 Tax=Nonlabens marinus S1-08 TaxID=1454201 RepID=W8W0D1_9FLAO|nr:hypothetical protein [Nonlabens marinus]BAO56116.1 hypothetical protein NMS_2107 [Nonlabens marinus S1-08]